MYRSLPIPLMSKEGQEELTPLAFGHLPKIRGGAGGPGAGQLLKIRGAKINLYPCFFR
jgi:hypothetical protein